MKKKPYRHAKLHITFKENVDPNKEGNFLDQYIQLIESLKLSTCGPSSNDFGDFVIFNNKTSHIGYKKLAVIRKWLVTKEEIKAFSLVNKTTLED